MKKHSCGAILYIIRRGTVYIVLGMEKGQWFPFKGLRDRGETNTQAAIREIKEETCNSVHITNIDLNCNYSTKRKHYHIGLVRITPDEFSQFYYNRENMLNDWRADNKSSCYNWNYLEKNDIKMFPVDDIMNYNFHEITEIPIKYYYNHLIKLQQDVRLGLISKKIKALTHGRVATRHSLSNITRLDHKYMMIV
jgi:ADP-ribose pyrophosphatase YjhB (NUDIX family)